MGEKLYSDGAKGKYFCVEELEGFKEFCSLFAKNLVDELKPTTVLHVGCGKGVLVDALRSRGIEAFGIDSSRRLIDEVVAKARPFCFECEFMDLDGFPKQLQKSFDLVVCGGVLNRFYADEVEAVVGRLCAFSNSVVVGFSAKKQFGQKVVDYGEINFGRMVGFFAQNEMFRSDFSFFRSGLFDFCLFSKKVQSYDAICAYEQRIEKLKGERVRLSCLNEKLNIKALNYCKNFVNLKYISHSYVALKQDYEDALIELNVLRATDEKCRAIIESSFWKLTKPLRFCLDGFKFAIKSIFHLFGLLIKGMGSIFKFGFRTTWNKVRRRKLSGSSHSDYVSYFEKIQPTYEVLQWQRGKRFKANHVVSIVVPLYNTPIKFLKELIDSVNMQTYSFWQLCLADGSDALHFQVRSLCESYVRKNPKIKYLKLDENLGIAQNTNAALKMATGSFVALLDHDDLLSPTALFECMSAVEKFGADFVYTDEMTFEKKLENVKFIHFKPDYSPDALCSNNYICHLSVFSAGLLKQVGGFSSNFDGSQDYDIILRLVEKAKKVVHIPKVLYYWRSHSLSVAQDLINKPYCLESAKRALSEHLKRVGLRGKVFDSRYPSTYRVIYDLKGCPKISIIIANKNSIASLKVCIDSILNSSTYENFEIVVVDNSSDEQTFDYYEILKKTSSKFRLVEFDGMNGEFNLSAMNNFGASVADGDYFVFMHSDVRITTSDWLQQMLMFAQREDVGAVGVSLIDSNDVIQGGGFFLSKKKVVVDAFRFLSSGEGGYMCRASFVQNLSAVSGACMMVGRKSFEEVDGFNEVLAGYFSDVDLCLRFRSKGFLVVYNPYVELQHAQLSAKNETRQKDAGTIARFETDKAYMLEKWADVLEKGDPYYNSNFDESGDFSVKKIEKTGFLL